MPSKIADWLKAPVVKGKTTKAYRVEGFNMLPRVDWLNKIDDILRRAGGDAYRPLRHYLTTSPTARAAIHLVVDQWASLPVAEQDEEGEIAEEPEMLHLLTGGRKDTLLHKIAEPVVWYFYSDGEVFIEKMETEELDEDFHPDLDPHEEINRRIDKLVVHDPETLENITYDENGQPAVYHFKADSDPRGYHGQYTTAGRGTYDRRRGAWHDDIPADRILHIPLFNPLNPNKPLPIAHAVIGELKLQSLLTAWSIHLAARRGRDFMYAFPHIPQEGQRKMLDHIEADKAEREFNSRMREREQRGDDIAVLTGAFDLKTLALSPGDIQMESLRADVRRVIATGLGVPAQLLGDIKSGSLTDSGRRQEMKELLLNTVIPLMDIFLSEMSDFLFAGFDPDDPRFVEREFVVDKGKVDVLGEERDSLHTRVRADYQAGLPTLPQALELLGYPTDDAPEVRVEQRGETLVAVSPSQEMQIMQANQRIYGNGHPSFN